MVDKTKIMLIQLQTEIELKTELSLAIHGNSASIVSEGHDSEP